MQTVPVPSAKPPLETKQIHVRLFVDQAQALKKLARQERTPMQVLIRRAVDEFLRPTGKKGRIV